MNRIPCSARGRSRAGRSAVLPILSTVVLALSILLLGCGATDSEQPVETAESESEGVTDSGESVTVYFPGQGGRLFAEERELDEGLSAQDRARAVVEILLAGPENRALFPPLSSETVLIDIDVDTTSGIAWVDLGGKNDEIAGSRRELLTIYSLVDSLALSVEEIDRVALLWNGIQGESFAGHIDTTQPLPPDPSYISREQ